MMPQCATDNPLVPLGTTGIARTSGRERSQQLRSRNLGVPTGTLTFPLCSAQSGTHLHLTDCHTYRGVIELHYWWVNLLEET